MEICIKFGGRVHCLFVPQLEVPLVPFKPGPGPVNYPAFLQDAVVWNTIQALTSKITDEKVRGALAQGLKESMKAMQEHAGVDVEIKAAERQG